MFTWICKNKIGTIYQIYVLQNVDIFNQDYFKLIKEKYASTYHKNPDPTHYCKYYNNYYNVIVCDDLYRYTRSHTWVILSILPSQLSLSSYNGSLCVPMNIGSQCRWYPVRFPVWNTLTPGLGLALAHSLNLGTVWQSGHTFLWKVMAEPFLSIDTCCRKKNELIKICKGRVCIKYNYCNILARIVF